ncbi:MAG: YeeE/YedE family protein [Thioalkalispiraceae bacterium]|jgi:uncharacterized membrane protein YedE/YeeE
MTFQDFASAYSFYIWSIFILSVILGAVVNKTNFCTMGAVSDLVNMGDKGRIRAWILAGTVAMIGVIILEYFGAINLSSTLPPYRGGLNPQTLEGSFPWGRYILGGVMFGIGMTLASGCGNKTLIRFGAGNIKSLFVFIIIAVIAYYMVDPFKQLEANWYQTLFQPWLDKASFTVTTQADVGSVFAGMTGLSAVTLRLILGAIIGAISLYMIFKAADFRSSFDNILAGVVIGLIVVAAWYITSNTMVNVDGDNTSLRSFVQDQWMMLMDSDAGKPKNASVNLMATSYTFISPMGQMLGYVKEGFSYSYLSFGVISVLGVIAGSFLWSLISRSFRIEWFVSFKDFVFHAIGGVLMGFGGVLGLGCTIGQGITGVSTLALGSFLVFISIVFGSALTMKIQYYKMVYEDEAGFFKALVTSLVDMKLLPNSLRQLEAV